MITKAYLIYFSALKFGIRWPVGWDFPTRLEVGMLCSAAFMFLAFLGSVLWRCAPHGR